MNRKSALKICLILSKKQQSFDQRIVVFFKRINNRYGECYNIEVFYMSEKTQQIQAVYSSSDIAITLKIQESTLRKYCLILEKNGYEFLKNENGHRAYFDPDIIVLKKFLELKNGTDMTLEQAAKSVISWHNGVVITESDTEGKRYNVRYNDLLDEFKSFKASQEAFNHELLKQLEKQQEYINKTLEVRDQNLMIVLKETLETKKQLALDLDEEQKKKWWEFWR